MKIRENMPIKAGMYLQLAYIEATGQIALATMNTRKGYDRAAPKLTGCQNTERLTASIKKFMNKHRLSSRKFKHVEYDIEYDPSRKCYLLNDTGKDKEMHAIERLNNIFRELGQQEISRVMNWANHKFLKKDLYND